MVEPGLKPKLFTTAVIVILNLSQLELGMRAGIQKQQHMWRTYGVSLPGVYLYRGLRSEVSVRHMRLLSGQMPTSSRGMRRFLFLDDSHCGFVRPVKEQNKNERFGIVTVRESAELMPAPSVISGEDPSDLDFGHCQELNAFSRHQEFQQQ